MTRPPAASRPARGLARLAAGAAMAALLAGAGLTALPGDAAHAASRKDVEKQQEANSKQRKALEGELEDTDDALKNAYLLLTDAQGDMKVAQVELQVAESDYATAKRESDELADRLGAAEEQRTEVAGQIKANESKIGVAQDSIAEMARDAAADGAATDTGLSLLLGSDSLPDLMIAAQSADIAAKAQQDALFDLEQERSAMANQQARLQAIEKEIAQLKARADAKAKEAQEAKDRAVAKKAEIQQIITKQQDLTVKLKAAKAEFTKKQATLDAEKKKLDDQLAEIAKKEAKALASGKIKSLPSGSGVFGYPVANPVITSPFGMRYHPILHYSRLHSGTDFGAGCGTPIYAAAAGKVEWAMWAGGYGNQVAISHGVIGGKSVATTYSHQSKFAVHTGQSVKRGQLIGYVGTTGMSTGCHLHFEVRLNGTPVNPMQYY